MKFSSKFRLLLGAAVLVGLGGSGALAQSGSDANPSLPDPTHVPFTLPDNIKWDGDPAKGELSYALLGDQKLPGLYIQLIKWLPGHYSHPHTHSTTRYITVISGVWWVSSSDVYDPTKTYPMPAGTIAMDMPNTVHWDGAKDEPCVVEVVGMGPVITKSAAKAP